MTHDGNYNDGAGHKDDGGHYRARREPRNTADAVARRAAAAKPGAKADQEPGDHDHHPACRHIWRRQGIAQKAARDRCKNEPHDESEPPDLVASREREAPAQNAANTGDASGEHHQQHRSETDQRAAEQSRDWIE